VTCPIEVRFTPKATQLLRSSEMTRWANTGHPNRSIAYASTSKIEMNSADYSIILSARRWRSPPPYSLAAQALRQS